MVNSVLVVKKYTLVGACLGALFALCLAAAGLATASEAIRHDSSTADPILNFADNQQKQRYHALIDELRCPKCQNQNLADSNAPIANDLRGQLYELIRDNKTDQQIRDYMVTRYGSFVLYNPPKNKQTVWLWVLPVIVFIAGLFLVVLLTRRRNTSATSDDSSGSSINVDDSSAQLQALRHRMAAQNDNKEREQGE